MKAMTPAVILLFSLTASCSSLAQDKGYLYTTDRSVNALTHAVGNLSDDEYDRFILGRSFFKVPWIEAPASTTARDGLGPLYNANSCSACHPGQGGGSAAAHNQLVDRSIVFKFSHQSNNHTNDKNSVLSNMRPDPVYGIQLAVNGTAEVRYEGQLKATPDIQDFTYPDGQKVVLYRPQFSMVNMQYGPVDVKTRLHPRRSLSLTGMGLIERIPQEQILQRQDVDDSNHDGISAKANIVWSQQTQSYELGKFGWKASVSSLQQQVADALSNDMGLTTELFPSINCSAVQQACLSARTGGQPEVPNKRLAAITYYLASLRVPEQAVELSAEGESLFRKMGCLQCHQVGFQLDDGTQVNPYSDFLLHDMGAGLADGSQVYLAESQEWRTPPLWGIGLARVLNPKVGFLHDGRAQTLEQAILWHGGEASKSRQNFIALSVAQRQSLLDFLHSL